MREGVSWVAQKSSSIHCLGYHESVQGDYCCVDKTARQASWARSSKEMSEV